MFKSRICLFILAAFFLFGCASTAKTPPVYTNTPNWEYLSGSSNVGFILCHGNGEGPDGYVVYPLRINLNKAGYHTLSLEMPMAGERMNFKKYIPYFPESYQRIQAAYDYLKNTKKLGKIYLVGHSMGARMTTAYLAKYPMVQYAGYIGAGVLNNGEYPLDAGSNIANIKIPVLDIYADNGRFMDATFAGQRKKLVSATYTQVHIKGANHTFDGYDDELTEAVLSWVQKQ